jgi:hypothetical protein
MEVLAKKDLFYLASLDTAIKQDNIKIIQDIVKTKTQKKIKFESGGEINLDLFSANAILTVYKALSKVAKEKMERMLNSNLINFKKVLGFTLSKTR